MTKNSLFYILPNSAGDIGIIAWLDRLENRTCRANFCTFNGTLLHEKIQLASYFLNTIIHMKGASDAFVFDAIIGLTPESNTSAMSFIKQCGMTEAGRIPNAIYNCVTETSEVGILTYYIRKD